MMYVADVSYRLLHVSEQRNLRQCIILAGLQCCLLMACLILA